jgi:hypothetical protein
MYYLLILAVGMERLIELLLTVRVRVENSALGYI